MWILKKEQDYAKMVISNALKSIDIKTITTVIKQNGASKTIRGSLRTAKRHESKNFYKPNKGGYLVDRDEKN